VNYNGVDEMFWPETSGWSDDERVVALYLLTCAHRKTEGLFRLPSVYAAHDMGWAVDRFDAGVRALGDRGWVIHEDDWMLLVNGLRWNPPKSETQIKGARNAVTAAPRASRVYRVFYGQAGAHCKPLQALLDAPQGPPEGVPGGYEAAVSGPTETSTPTPTPSPSQFDSTTAVVVPPSPEVREEIDRACDAMAAVGLHVHDRRTVERLADEHPEVDIVQAAINCAEWKRAANRRVTHPLRALAPFVTAEDAPGRTHLRAVSGGRLSEHQKSRQMTERLRAQEEASRDAG
jgi:hypothetical protein